MIFQLKHIDDIKSWLTNDIIAGHDEMYFLIPINDDTSLRVLKKVKSEGFTALLFTSHEILIIQEDGSL